VPPAALSEVAKLAQHGLPAVSAAIGAIFGEDGTTLGTGVFRYVERLVDLEALGEWVDTDDPRLPGWLRPFNGGILIVCDERDRYMAGVGIKRHDEFRGRGLARRLVATAARDLVRAGSTVTYEHALDNAQSGAVAAAAGFPDRGWRAIHLGDEE
jgi:ribosomal protein S18 acetylase RimI-like enzyme